jgi:hypothetical protein
VLPAWLTAQVCLCAEETEDRYDSDIANTTEYTAYDEIEQGTERPAFDDLESVDRLAIWVCSMVVSVRKESLLHLRCLYFWYFEAQRGQ